MNLILVCLCLFGVILSIDARCDPLVPKLGTPLTGPGSRATYNNYMESLKVEANGCNSGLYDKARNGILMALFNNAKELRDTYGDFSAAGGLTISVFSLLLPVMTAFFKP